jgi:uncharacterized protein YdiU (UPF0061 family)
MNYLGQNLGNSTLDFATLGEDFFSEIVCQPLKNTFLIHKNQALYNKLGLDWDSQTLLKIASGEQSFQGVSPIASVYSGHQFGHFAGQLGDGRSCLIGQVLHNPPLQEQIGKPLKMTKTNMTRCSSHYNRPCFNIFPINLGITPHQS